MKKVFFLLVFAACVSFSAIAQNKDVFDKSGLAISLGAEANYYFGQSNRNFDHFENERLNWQLNGMLGITIARDRGGRRTMIAAFGGYGFNNKSTLNHTFDDQQYVTLATDQSSMNNYYKVEGGLLLGEVLRVSTGIGRQSFNEQTLISDEIKPNASYLEYYSSTVGFNINLGSVAWIINCNFAYGKDYNKTVLTPGTGIMLRF